MYDPWPLSKTKPIHVRYRVRADRVVRIVLIEIVAVHQCVVVVDVIRNKDFHSVKAYVGGVALEISRAILRLHHDR